MLKNYFRIVFLNPDFLFVSFSDFFCILYFVRFVFLAGDIIPIYYIDIFIISVLNINHFSHHKLASSIIVVILPHVKKYKRSGNHHRHNAGNFRESLGN